MADPETISYQTQQVTTEVFPSEMGEGEIPWWVWLLAALLGLLLLAIITLCLYKVSTKIKHLHWKLVQQTPSFGSLLAYLETTA